LCGFAADFDVPSFRRTMRCTTIHAQQIEVCGIWGFKRLEL